MENKKDEWSFKTSDPLTIPNILTYIRFILIIPFMILFLQERYVPSAICIALSGLRDCLDGLIALKFNQFSA
ncbi:MAG: CDP-alcohol phosphatidyltransferase family protein [Clostridiales bacterium]|nr:CDP-alcohol phosphatidyltransferase family protein [Clostridiales bacterium]